MDISTSTVLVTGGAGLIGSHLVDALIERGCQVKILDSLESYTHPQGEPDWIHRSATLIVGNVLDRDMLKKALQGVDVVFHQAGFTGFDPDSTRYIDVNATATARLYDVIEENKLPVRKIVFASSLSVYGEGKYQCAGHGPQYPSMRSLKQMHGHDWAPRCLRCKQAMRWLATDEDSLKEPFTPYAVSKYAGELLALAMGQRYEIPTVALRYAVAYGPRQSVYNAYSTVITTFATLLANDRSPVLYEDGLQCRDWTYVGDIVRANLHVMEESRADFRSFNVGTGEPASVREVAEILARQLGRDIEPVVPGEFRPGDIRNMVLDISRLKQIGFEPKVTLEEGISHLLEWFRTLGKVEDLYSGLEQRMRKTGELTT